MIVLRLLPGTRHLHLKEALNPKTVRIADFWATGGQHRHYWQGAVQEKR